ncbi:TPA: hypothetical protein HA335_05020 [Methanocaldococcus jannaschii]|nr:hypothetical protein [Methanocaldococcus jannaschii]HII59922.1 hypothetical protein [Methanocaldococcus jannaschii]
MNIRDKIKSIKNWINFIKPIITIVGIVISAVAFTISILWGMLFLILFLILITFSKTIRKILSKKERSYQGLILSIIGSIIIISIIVYSHCYIEFKLLI